jgi:hypothetical protein
MSEGSGELLAQRYSLRLESVWREWFDRSGAAESLRGAFHTPVDVPALLGPAPLDLWPGFMLPDSLPLVSNGYGDWWCARVGPDDRLCEVIHWFHGGGDWIPIGSNVAEAAVWDALSGWRGSGLGGLHAAHEYPARPTPSLSHFGDGERWWIDWLSAHLRQPPRALEQLLAEAAAGNYAAALARALELGISHAAVTCEQIELALQGQRAELADPAIAAHFGLNSFPEFTSWLFDSDLIAPAAQSELRARFPRVTLEQDWDSAARLAAKQWQQRRDLSWPANILGWSAERRGDLDTALAVYFSARHTSAFTDQSVRLRSHWHPERYGKFAVARLHQWHERLAPEQANDPYLQILWHEPAARTRTAIREFWLQRAADAMQQHDFPTAYTGYMQAGWDLGAERLSDYREILDGLVASAQAAGWNARAQVAAAHRECLAQRLPL